LICNTCCSCHEISPLSVSSNLPVWDFTHTQLLHQSLPHQLWVPVHQHIWHMRSHSEPSSWTLIPW
jgi:hypothetical protein